MGKTKKVGITGKFGARYGLKIRRRIKKIEEKQKAKNECPYCHKNNALIRTSAGIWQCKKCKKKFTGRAYEPK